MKRRNKVFVIIFSALLGIQSMGLPNAFAEMRPVEKDIFDDIERKRHPMGGIKCDNRKIIRDIMEMNYEGKSLEFKLYCLSMLFRLGAKSGYINSFVEKNRINLDDTSNPGYIYLIYRSIYYRREVLPYADMSEKLNKKLNESLDKILNNGIALLSDILRDKEKFRKYSDFYKKYIMRSIFYIQKNGLTYIPKAELKSLLKGFTYKDFGSGLESLFPYIRAAETDNLTKKRLIEEGIRKFKNIDEFLKDKDRRGLLLEYLKIPEVDCKKKYEFACKMIEYYKNIMSVHTDPHHSEYLRYVNVVSILASVPVGDNSYKKVQIQEWLTCYEKKCRKPVFSDKRFVEIIIEFCKEIGIDNEYKIRLMENLINYYTGIFKESVVCNPNYQEAVLLYGKISGGDNKNKEKLLLELISYYIVVFKESVLHNPNYQEAVLAYGGIPGGDTTYKGVLIQELIEYYKENYKDVLNNPTYEEIVLVYEEILWGNLEYKEKLVEELINNYRERLKEFALDNQRYEQLVLAYAKIPRGNMKNKGKLLKELISYYPKKCDGDVLGNPKYEQLVLTCVRNYGISNDYKIALLKEFIRRYRSVYGVSVLSNPTYEEAVLMYERINRNNMKKYEEQLIKELLNYYKKTFKEDVLNNIQYVRTVLAYARIHNDDTIDQGNWMKKLIDLYREKFQKSPLHIPEYRDAVLLYAKNKDVTDTVKSALLRELIDFCKYVPKYDSFTNEAMATYVKIPGNNLENKIEYLEKLIEVGLGRRYDLSYTISSILDSEYYDLETSQILKLGDLVKKI